MFENVLPKTRAHRRLLVLERMEDRRLLTTVDLASLLATGGSTIHGADAGDVSGVNVRGIGDLNADGVDDFFIAAPVADSVGNQRDAAGEAYVIFGGNNLPSTIDLGSLGSHGITIFGADPGDSLAHGSNAGDLNGDGVDDLILGARYADSVGNTREEAGEAYVIFGSPLLPSTIDLAVPGSSDITIYGIDAGDWFGNTSGDGAGDINADGIDDLVLGATHSMGADNLTNVAGEAYIIFGQATWPATIDLASPGAADITLYGDGAYVGGQPGGVGDVNGDGIDDVMISSNRAQGVGETYIIYGSSSLQQTTTIDLDSLDQSGVTIRGKEGQSLGRGADRAGDVNGDGYSDVILGSHDLETYVIYGGPSLPSLIEVSNLGQAGVVLTGTRTNFGVAGAGDVNGDGFDDVILIDSSSPGPTHLVFGGASLAETIDLQNIGSAGVTILGADGTYVASAGDVNGDGFTDVLIGNPEGDGPSGTSDRAGETYLLYGAADFPGVSGLQTIFEDSFEVAEWNGTWTEDNQNSWFRSSQRASDGSWSAEVDGRANNSTLELNNSLDLSGTSASSMSFEWLIEGGFDSGEYVALDISTDGGANWNLGVRQLDGNQSQEDVWHQEAVDLTPFATNDVKIRFRASVSSSREDANVDNIRIIGVPINTDPTPGISVSPTTGLQTSETGGTAAFDVVLDSQPTADVTIAVSSSNTAEGTVSVSTLTFTPTNWDQPQTILVTGVDDTLEDGDVGYLIITAAAVSSDPDYNGLDPADVAITNLDDDFNYAPVAVDDSATIDQDTQAVIDVLANDSDPEGASLTIASVGPASSGSVVLNPDQTLTYSPNAGFSGTDSFTYQISDGEKTAQATVTITVRDTTLTSVFVADISFQSRKGDKEWRANVEVRDENNQPVQGVRVSLTFGSIDAIFITDANGRIQTGWQRISSGSTAEIDTDVSPGGGYVWDQSLYELFGYATGIEDKDGDGRPDKTN